MFIGISISIASRLAAIITLSPILGLFDDPTVITDGTGIIDG